MIYLVILCWVSLIAYIYSLSKNIISLALCSLVVFTGTCLMCVYIKEHEFETVQKVEVTPCKYFFQSKSKDLMFIECDGFYQTFSDSSTISKYPYKGGKMLLEKNKNDVLLERALQLYK